MNWQKICNLTDIPPSAGVAARLAGQQIALFRVGDGDQVRAIGNHDPLGGANVLARGLVGSLKGKVVVASPLYKHHYCLETGVCLEEPETTVPCYQVKVENGEVWAAA